MPTIVQPNLEEYRTMAFAKQIDDKHYANMVGQTLGITVNPVNREDLFKGFMMSKGIDIVNEEKIRQEQVQIQKETMRNQMMMQKQSAMQKGGGSQSQSRSSSSGRTMMPSSTNKLKIKI